VNIILFGAAGQLGTVCAKVLANEGYNLIPLTRSEADFSQPAVVEKKVKELKPDLVINACAYTAVDKAESEKDLADLVNHQSVKAIAKACSSLSIPLIHISTDYVFDGTCASPYRETDPVSPLGVYGETKLLGEQAIQAALNHYIILRTSWVFGEYGNNFVKTMLRVGATRSELKVVDDQIGRPTYVGDIVEAILFFVQQYESKRELVWGVYHCSSEGLTSWHGFAQTIFELAGDAGVIDSVPNVLPIPSSEYPTPAPRPTYSVLSTQKLEALMGRPLPHWKQGLLRFLKRLKAQN